jgi:hypothetical protein
VFDPSTAPATLADPMRSLLAQAPSYARSCLVKATGAIAGAGSCAGPWWVTADAQLTLDPALFGGSRRVSASLRLTNLPAAVDALLHGGNVRGWGSPTFVDPVLLRPTGFDAAGNRFLYDVNPRFGAGLGSRGLVNPFAVTLDISVIVGPDPRGERLASQLGRRPGQTRQTATALKARYRRFLANPARMVLQLRDSLMLSNEQVRRLGAVAEGFDVEQDSLWTPVTTELVALPADFDATRMIERVNSTYSEGQLLAMRWGRELARILTKEQREATPAYVQELMAGEHPFAEMAW